MKIEIAALPRFYLHLSLEQIEIIASSSSTHYDGVCRKASQLGGFVYGWQNVLRYTQDPIPVSATRREVDLTLKILEGVEPSKRDEAFRITTSLRAALRMADNAEWPDVICDA